MSVKQKNTRKHNCQNTPVSTMESSDDWLKYKFKVCREHSGLRADLFLSDRLARLSRSKLQKIISKYAFDESGKPLKSSRRLTSGEIITLYRPRPDEPDVPRFFSVLFEDNCLMIIDKPAGLPVHQTAKYHLNTLTALLQEKYGNQKPVMVHRLDKETSGIMILAKDKNTEVKMKKKFADRQIKKTYLAVVRGILENESGKIEAPIGPDDESPINVKMTCRKDGLPALTEYRTIRKFNNMTLLECHPRTGRQHQIRTHLEHLGYPVLGDKMYGCPPELFLDYLVDGQTLEIAERAGFHRQALHASKIEFSHPLTGKDVCFECPMPDDMKNLCDQETSKLEFCSIKSM